MNRARLIAGLREVLAETKDHPAWADETLLRWAQKSNPAQTEPRPHVYLVLGGHDEEASVKIGWTAGATRKRLRELQSCSPSPLRALATIPGPMCLERDLHRRFDALRLHGEWFRLVEDLVVFAAMCVHRVAEVVEQLRHIT